MIKAQNLIRKFQMGNVELIALKGLNFTIADNEFISITGKSGSGKSTLLYQLSALDVPTEGDVFIDDVNIAKLSSNDQSRFRLYMLGYIFQDYALLPELTALENVMIPLIEQGETLNQAKIKAVQALEKVNMGDRINNRPNQLSGGQQQRVSIARAIGHSPKIIFADEPTANLDNETSKVVLDIFLNLHKNGQTIVMVTHEKEYAKLAQRTIELSDGIIISDTRNSVT